MKIKVKELKNILDKYSKDECEIEFWFGDIELVVDTIGNFNLIPDIVIRLKEREEFTIYE